MVSGGLWPFLAPRAANLSVRSVPEAEVYPGILNVGYREAVIEF